ncbi:MULTISPECIES: hypothetical protein [Mycolicibacterium]|nr:MULTISPECIES: hypothetical protein [Mycolicibacterium]MDO0973509.1 hypothetical protein [Mycolicibacterium frederiksbergense]
MDKSTMDNLYRKRRRGRHSLSPQGGDESRTAFSASDDGRVRFRRRTTTAFTAEQMNAEQSAQVKAALRKG